MLNITLSCITAKAQANADAITKAQAHADAIKAKAIEVYEAADAANHECDFAIMRRKKANDAAYRAACEVRDAYAAVAALKA